MYGPATVVLLALLSAAGGPYDTVRLADGGLARGTVIEDDTTNGVTLQFPDGTARHWTRAEVTSIEYAEQASPVPEASRPQPFSERAPWPFTLSLGTGGALTEGQVGSRAGSTSDWWTGFILFQVEAGFRIRQAWTTLAYLDGGGGDAAQRLVRACNAQGLSCGAGSVRLGLMERYAFAPAASRTPWIALGTGYETTGVMAKGSAGREYISFDGWEVLKLAGGYDFRFTRIFGIGLFAGVSLATYGNISVSGPEYLSPPVLGDQRLHAWFQLGGRLILFP